MPCIKHYFGKKIILYIIEKEMGSPSRFLPQSCNNFVVVTCACLNFILRSQLIKLEPHSFVRYLHTVVNRHVKSSV